MRTLANLLVFSASFVVVEIFFHIILGMLLEQGTLTFSNLAEFIAYEISVFVVGLWMGKISVELRQNPS